MSRFTSGGELRPMLALAVPVIIAEVGWVAMTLVDTIMLGRVDAEAVGGMGVGRVLFFTVAIFGVGLLLGLDTVVSQDHGAGRAASCARWLGAGLWLAVGLGLPISIGLGPASGLIPLAGVRPEVAERAVAYLDAIRWGAIPLLLYSAFRRYLQAVGRARPVMIALLSANLINVAGNRVLIFGAFGIPALGSTGAGWSTVIAYTYLAVFTGAVSVVHVRESGPLRAIGWRPEARRLRRLATLGVPAAAQITLELGAFSGASVLAARLAPSVLAAHHIALSLVSLSYMLPIGLASAAAVRVGHGLGRGDPVGARRAGTTALVLAAFLAIAAAIVFVAIPRLLLRAFTPDEAVIAAGASLLLVGALFQLFDGVQAVATGALRGAGDTRTSAIWSLLGHWVIGLPVGAWLCFSVGLGASGLWVGWLVGLGTVAVVLLRAWARHPLDPGGG